MQSLVTRGRCVARNSIGNSSAYKRRDDERMTTSRLSDENNSRQGRFVAGRDERCHPDCCVKSQCRAVYDRLRKRRAERPTCKKQRNEHRTDTARPERKDRCCKFEPAEYQKLRAAVHLVEDV